MNTHASQRGLPKIAVATQIVFLENPLLLHRGGELTHVEIGYQSWGTLNAAVDNAVLLFTGISPSPHAASNAIDPNPGWWEFMIGPGKPIDTDRYFVVCVNSLGSCFGSTGPASPHPDDGLPYRMRFPDTTVEDIASAAQAALLQLGITRLHSVVGPSMGGMVALSYAKQFADSVGGLVVISAAAQALPFAIAIRSLQREVVRNDPEWCGGSYAVGAGPVRGITTARKLGLTSYRSPQEWQQRFGHLELDPSKRSDEPFGIQFQIESYLDHNAHKFSEVFDANCFLYLSRALDWFSLAEDEPSIEQALQNMAVERALIIGVETDILFPLNQQQELAQGLRKGGAEVEYVALPCIQGHDAFLVDESGFAPPVKHFFD